MLSAGTAKMLSPASPDQPLALLARDAPQRLDDLDAEGFGGEAHGAASLDPRGWPQEGPAPARRAPSARPRFSSHRHRPRRPRVATGRAGAARAAVRSRTRARAGRARSRCPRRAAPGARRRGAAQHAQRVDHRLVADRPAPSSGSSGAVLRPARCAASLRACARANRAARASRSATSGSSSGYGSCGSSATRAARYGNSRTTRVEPHARRARRRVRS